MKVSNIFAALQSLCPPMNKLLALCFVTVCSVAAQASFELVMVADTGTRSVHRFDGATGAYFGSFGGGFLSNVDSFNIDRSTGLAYVGDNSLGMTRVFNYNTGQHVADVAVGNNGYFGTHSRTADGRFIGGYLIGAFTVESTTGAPLGLVYTQQVDGTSSVAMSSAVHSSGRVIGTTYSSFSSVAALQIFDPSEVGTPTAFKSAEVTNMGQYASSGQISLQGDRGIWVSGTGFLRNFTVSDGATSVALGSSFAPAGFAASSLKGVGFGHGNTVYLSGRNTGNTSGIVTRGVVGSSATLGSFGSGILQNPAMIQTVVAPEPGTLLALGAGAAMLARRRRPARDR